MDHRRGPFLLVGLLLEDLVDVDREAVRVASDRVAVHTARGPPLDEGSVGTILRVVLRTLELLVVLLPAQGRVLMRTGEGERIDRALPANENDFVLPVDRYA